MRRREINCIWRGARLAGYFVTVQISVRPTTDTSHGHALGMCTHVMRSYCVVCKAGCGKCYHHASLLWMQHLHWGEDRPTPKPPTASFAPWIPGSRSTRSCTKLAPASRSHREKLPTSNKEEKQKKISEKREAFTKGYPYNMMCIAETKGRKQNKMTHIM